MISEIKIRIDDPQISMKVKEEVNYKLSQVCTIKIGDLQHIETFKLNVLILTGFILIEKVLVPSQEFC